MNPKLRIRTTLLLLVTLDGYILGIGKPLILFWSESTIFNIYYSNGGTTNASVTMANFQSVAINSLYVCFESILFCSIATICLTYYIINRKKLTLKTEKSRDVKT